MLNLCGLKQSEFTRDQKYIEVPSWVERGDCSLLTVFWIFWLPEWRGNRYFTKKPCRSSDVICQAHINLNVSDWRRTCACYELLAKFRGRPPVKYNHNTTYNNFLSYFYVFIGTASKASTIWPGYLHTCIPYVWDDLLPACELLIVKHRAHIYYYCFTIITRHGHDAIVWSWVGCTVRLMANGGRSCA